MTVAAQPLIFGARPGRESPAHTSCAHCRLPVPPGLVEPGADAQFCCEGCRTAFGVIHSCGLENYYRLVDRAEDERAPARTTRRAYAEFDDPTFHALYCRALPGGLIRAELILEGIHCAACVWLVEKLPRVLPGVVESRLQLRSATVAVTFDGARVPLSRVARTLNSLGYPPHPARGPAAREARRVEDRRMLVRMAVAGACAGNIMLLFFALYAGSFEGIERGYEQLFRWTAMALNTLCLAWPGAVFARGAIGAIRTRTIHLDVPIALGLHLGGAWGIWKTVAGSGDIYFDSISALVFFLLVGRYVQQRQQRAAADSVELLFSLCPSVARRVDGGRVMDVPTEALREGDTVEVRPGESVPADGVVIDGDSRIDLSLMTGESRPARCGPGGHVPAGAVNVSSAIRLRVESTGERTRIGRLMKLVEDASRRRARIVRLADRWGARLLWILLGLAAVTLAAWWHAGPEIAIDRAAALLIATCPCGLGLATPLAMTVAIGRAARRGILIKGGDALQSLAESSGEIVLDKTGTLTFGRLSLVRWDGDPSALELVRAVERHSTHPAAMAIAGGADRVGEAGATDVVQFNGEGIEGTVDGRRVGVGTESFLARCGARIGTGMKQYATNALNDGCSPVFASVDGECVGVGAMGDPVRPDAADAVRALRSRGWRVSILSGDHPGVVAAVARQLGVEERETRGGATPEEKLRIVREMASRGTVVMVGDGVNDAGALAAASVGVAVRGSAEASLASADVTLLREGIGPVVDLLEGARRAMRTIRVTIGASLAYNVLAAGLCVAGVISPLLAAFIMPASSFTVVAICLRSGAFRQRPGAAR